MQTEVQQWQVYTQISENLNQSWLLNTFSILLQLYCLITYIELQDDLELIYATSMAIRVVEFSNGVYKIRNIFAKKSTYPKEIIKFWELD